MQDAAHEATGAPEANSNEAGFVLLSVLLAVALFMAAAASFAVKSQLAAMQTANRIEQARARALADGAVLFAVDALTAAQPAAKAKNVSLQAASTRTETQRLLPFAGDGSPLSCALAGDRRIELSVVDQGGLLDLNAASPEMIADLLEAAGLDGERALQVAGAIVDFRDQNDVPEAGGASEEALYREAGKPWGPRNGAFLDAAEIAQLPAFPPDLVAKLQPLFTVHNAEASLDFTVMDRRARALFPREIKGVDALTRWSQPSGRKAFSVEAALRRSDGTVAAARHGLAAFGGTSLEALAEEAGRPQPPRIEEWREMLLPAADRQAPPAASPVCEQLQRALEGDVALRP